MNSSGKTNQQQKHPCQIRAEDIKEISTTYWNTGFGPIPIEHIETHNGKKYQRDNHLFGYYMTDMSTLNRTHCPCEWWQKWTGTDK